jgi:hypothetical protein
MWCGRLALTTEDIISMGRMSPGSVVVEVVELGGGGGGGEAVRRSQLKLLKLRKG